MTDSVLHQKLKQLSTKLLENGYMVATAESCTGGLVAKSATDLEGSSEWFSRALVTYTNTSKHELLSVNESTLKRFGAVSEQTVIEMVNGLLAFDEISLGVSISGIAGPGGGSDEKPVGTVFIAWKLLDKPVLAKRFLFNGDRSEIRQQAAIEAVNGLIDCLRSDQ